MSITYNAGILGLLMADNYSIIKLYYDHKKAY